MAEICFILTIKTPERSQEGRFGASIVDFEQVPQIAVVFLLLTLNK